MIFLSAMTVWPIVAQPRPVTIANPSEPAIARLNTPRRTLGTFFDKLRGGRAVTVAYLGEAATAGAGLANPEKTSFRAQVTSWLRSQFPRNEIAEINAAVAGTGSLYGTMRLRRDVLAFKPDLVFIELAVSDSSEEERVVKKAVEGLLRQLLIVPQPPEIVLLYPTTSQRGVRTEWHETLADYYGVPSLDLQRRVWARIDSGQLSPNAFWKDGVAATETGHKFYAEQIISLLSEQLKQEATPLPRTIPPPLISDELNYGEFKAIAEIRHALPWRLEPSNDRLLPTSLLSTDKSGAEIEYYFEGTVLGLTYLKGPDAGMIEVLIDGKPAPAPLAKIDCYAKNARLGATILAGGLGLGEHRLTIRVLAEKNPQSGGGRVKLGYLLIGGQRPERL